MVTLLYTCCQATTQRALQPSSKPSHAAGAVRDESVTAKSSSPFVTLKRCNFYLCKPSLFTRANTKLRVQDTQPTTRQTRPQEEPQRRPNDHSSFSKTACRLQRLLCFQSTRRGHSLVKLRPFISRGSVSSLPNNSIKFCSLSRGPLQHALCLQHPLLFKLVTLYSVEKNGWFTLPPHRVNSRHAEHHHQAAARRHTAGLKRKRGPQGTNGPFEENTGLLSKPKEEYLRQKARYLNNPVSLASGLFPDLFRLLVDAVTF